jgi:hypothetical protein
MRGIFHPLKVAEQHRGGRFNLRGAGRERGSPRFLTEPRGDPGGADRVELGRRHRVCPWEEVAVTDVGERHARMTGTSSDLLGSTISAGSGTAPCASIPGAKPYESSSVRRRLMSARRIERSPRRPLADFLRKFLSAEVFAEVFAEALHCSAPHDEERSRSSSLTGP